MFEERPRPRRRLPLRTLILMVIALIAFIRFYWVTQQRRSPPRPPGRGIIVDVQPLPEPPAPASPSPQADAGTP